MLKRGKLTIEEIAEYTELSVEEVEQLVGLQNV
jgi:predicted transposase YdaD